MVDGDGGVDVGDLGLYRGNQQGRVWSVLQGGEGEGGGLYGNAENNILQLSSLCIYIPIDK